MTMSRRTFLKIAVAGGLAAGAGFLWLRNPSRGEAGLPGSNACNEYDLDCIASHLVSGGPPRDGIPSINKPVFVMGSDAEAKGWINDRSIVDAIVTQTGPRAYPRSITVWHEIVNDSINGQPASLTFCPLTGSSLIFRGKAPDGRPLTFGTTGMLYNSNLVMYDRQTNSMYPQILGIGISGPHKDVELEQIPVTTTTWGQWKTLHPDSAVLSRNTEYSRDYNRYPYGDYDSNNSVFFPVAYQSPSFNPKKVVIGTRIGRESMAVLRDEFRSKVVANLALGGEPIAAFYDSSTDFVRMFSRKTNGSDCTFSYDNSQIKDIETGTVWNPSGLAETGSLAGTQLRQMPHLQVMWFGWYAFHPTTAIVP